MEKIWELLQQVFTGWRSFLLPLIKPTRQATSAQFVVLQQPAQINELTVYLSQQAS